MARPLQDIRAVGAALRAARNARGWTQADLAERAGVSRQFVISLERGAGPRAEFGRVMSVIRALDKGLLVVDAQGPPANPGNSLSEILDAFLPSAESPR